MQIEDKMVNLAPGMAVTVEIKTGKRRIKEYLISRFVRYRQESLRERRKKFVAQCRNDSLRAIS